MKKKLLSVFLLFSVVVNAQVTDASALYQKVINSVVMVETDNSIGSGFFVDKDVIATNFHVIEGSSKGNIYLHDSYTPMQIIGVLATDEVNDLALLKVKSYSGAPLKFASTQPVQGNKVFAFGSPKGLEGTISDGIVSNLLDVQGVKLIQITAPISSGSSGGPILNERGEVIGVAVATIRSGQNLNLAIPSKLLETLIHFKKAYVTPLSDFNSAYLAKLQSTSKNVANDGVGSWTDYYVPVLPKPMNIKLTVKGLENTEMILANYLGDKQYVKDTFKFDNKGVITLKADTVLPGGVYLAVFPAMGNRYFEFIVSETQFTLETDSNDLTGHMKVTNSKENALFYGDMKFLGAMKQKSDSLAKLYREAKDQGTKDKYMAQLKALDNEVKTERTAVITNNADMFYGKLVRAMKDIDVPEFPRDAAGKIIDSAWQWRYYKAHYWDNTDLRDDRLLRCPVLHNKLKTFMTQTTVQHPDSIIVSGEDVLGRTDKKGEMYRYILTYIFNEMANSKVMGFDAAYVHFGKEYFCKPDMTPWIDTAKRFKICDRVNRLEPVLVGKKAQRLILWTDSTETQWKSLYDVKAKYTVVAFWDPDCGHCKKEIPVLVEAYHNLKKMGISVEVYSPAIMDMDNYKDWVEFIQKNNLDWINVCDAKRHNNFRWEWDIQSTPQLYILDAEKKIVARRIGADQIEDYIRHLEDPSYKPKNLMKVNDEDKQEGAE